MDLKRLALAILWAIVTIAVIGGLGLCAITLTDMFPWLLWVAPMVFGFCGLVYIIYKCLE